jgi:hypothetical protein
MHSIFDGDMGTHVIDRLMTRRNAPRLRCKSFEVSMQWNIGKSHFGKFSASCGSLTGNREINKKTTPTSDRRRSIKSAISFGSVSLLIPQDQAADAWGCRSLAPMMVSHSMMASSPNITGKTQLETLCSYCGHNMPVTLVAR